MHVTPRRALSGAAVAASLALTATAGSAQVAGVNPFSFGVSAGGAIPTGDTGDLYNTGYSVDGVVAVRVPTSALSFRGEVGYTRFDIRNSDDNDNYLTGVANLVYTFSPGHTAVVRTYLIGGVGAYSGRRTLRAGNVTTNTDRETDVGFNGGIGLEIPLSGITGFGEVRYTSIRTEGSNTNFVPIRFGIRF